jgi:hypothetical protein
VSEWTNASTRSKKVYEVQTKPTGVSQKAQAVCKVCSKPKVILKLVNNLFYTEKTARNPIYFITLAIVASARLKVFSEKLKCRLEAGAGGSSRTHRISAIGSVSLSVFRGHANRFTPDCGFMKLIVNASSCILSISPGHQSSS